MIVTVVHIRVKEEHFAEFMRATEANHLASRGEPGNLRFDVLRERGKRGQAAVSTAGRLETKPVPVPLCEAYATEEAAVAHKETPHNFKMARGGRAVDDEAEGGDAIHGCGSWKSGSMVINYTGAGCATLPRGRMVEGISEKGKSIIASVGGIQALLREKS